MWFRFFFEWLNSNGITAIIAALGFLLSLVTAIRQFILDRKAIHIRIVGYRYAPEMVKFVMVFENRSRLPISVTRIALISDAGKEQEIDCEYLCVLVGVDRWTDQNSQEVVRRYNLPVPISLAGLQGCSGFVLFDSPSHGLTAESKSATFLIHTSRGNQRRMTLELPPDSALPRC